MRIASVLDIATPSNASLSEITEWIEWWKPSYRTARRLVDSGRNLWSMNRKFNPKNPYPASRFGLAWRLHAYLACAACQAFISAISFFWLLMMSLAIFVSIGSVPYLR